MRSSSAKFHQHPVPTTKSIMQNPSKRQTKIKRLARAFRRGAGARGASGTGEALQLAWSLEDRGAVLALDGNDLIVDVPRGILTDADQAAIRRWKRHLIALAGYRVSESIQ